jgi:peptidoglycan/LPS O-acetylase OafA/YrhL
MNLLGLNKTDRVFGLDILRATAILFVLYSHQSIISSTDTDSAHNIYLFGFWGVELFFVLSGFLIGNQLIRLAETKSPLFDYFVFLKKRWIRTLPLYFVVLGLYYFFIFESFPWKHLFFLQNSFRISGNDALIFGQSWSLTIEEYSYLIIPILFFFIGKFNKWSMKYMTLFILIGLFTIPLIARILYVTNYPYINYDEWIRKSTFLRIDAIVIGVLLAWIKKHYTTLYHRLSNPIVPIICMLFIFLSNHFGNILTSKDTEYLFFPSTFGLMLVSISLVLIIPFFDRHPVNHFLSKIKIFYFGITLTAILSYCIYLIHMPIYEYFYIQLDGKIPFKLNVALMLLTIYSISLISYIAIEKPLLNLFK